VLETGAVFGELVEIRCFDDGVAVTAETVAALLVGGDEDDVGAHRKSRG